MGRTVLTEVVRLRIDRDTYRALGALAEAQESSVSRLIRIAVRDYLRANQK